MSNRIILGRTLSLALLIIGAAAILLPFVWMISLSLKPQDEIFTATIQLLPSRLEWQNFFKAVTQTDVPRYLLNGVNAVFEDARLSSPWCLPRCWCPFT